MCMSYTSTARRHAYGSQQRYHRQGRSIEHLTYFPSTLESSTPFDSSKSLDRSSCEGMGMGMGFGGKSSKTKRWLELVAPSLRSGRGTGCRCGRPGQQLQQQQRRRRTTAAATRSARVRERTRAGEEERRGRERRERALARRSAGAQEETKRGRGGRDKAREKTREEERRRTKEGARNACTLSAGCNSRSGCRRPRALLCRALCRCVQPLMP